MKNFKGKTSTSLASILDANTDDETPKEAEQENMMIEMLPENLEDTELNKLKKTINQKNHYLMKEPEQHLASSCCSTMQP